VDRRLQQVTDKQQQHVDSFEQSFATKSDSSAEKKRLETELQQAIDVVKELENNIVQTKELLLKERDVYDEMQRKLYAGNEQIARLVSRKEMLEEMKDSFQGFFYGVKEILQASKKGHLQHIHGAVLDVMEVP